MDESAHGQHLTATAMVPDTTAINHDEAPASEEGLTSTTGPNTEVASAKQPAPKLATEPVSETLPSASEPANVSASTVGQAASTFDPAAESTIGPLSEAVEPSNEPAADALTSPGPVSDAVASGIKHAEPPVHYVNGHAAADVQQPEAEAHVAADASFVPGVVLPGATEPHEENSKAEQMPDTSATNGKSSQDAGAAKKRKFVTDASGAEGKRSRPNKKALVGQSLRKTRSQGPVDL